MNRLPLVLAIVLFSGIAHAQSERVGWTRANRSPREVTRIFHAPAAINLPTTETLQRGFYQFEISHRFVPPFSGGFDDLYGLDGPVNIRLGLGYAPTDHLLITLARSNVRDNVDLQVKYGRVSTGKSSLPVQGALVAGVAWNTDVPWHSGRYWRDVQLYGQAIVNFRPTSRWAVGIVPTFLYNSILESADVERALTLGVYGQWYLTRIFSLMAEWNITEAGYYYRHDAAAFGIELETGGHFFKIVATNSTALNPSQFVIGTNDRFEPDNWRLGFNITRLLKF
jgi:hypothetical protein